MLCSFFSLNETSLEVHSEHCLCLGSRTRLSQNKERVESHFTLGTGGEGTAPSISSAESPLPAQRAPKCVPRGKAKAKHSELVFFSNYSTSNRMSNEEMESLRRFCEQAKSLSRGDSELNWGIPAMAAAPQALQTRCSHVDAEQGSQPLHLRSELSLRQGMNAAGREERGPGGVHRG